MSLRVLCACWVWLTGPLCGAQCLLSHPTTSKPRFMRLLWESGLQASRRLAEPLIFSIEGLHFLCQQGQNNCGSKRMYSRWSVLQKILLCGGPPLKMYVFLCTFFPSYILRDSSRHMLWFRPQGPWSGFWTDSRTRADNTWEYQPAWPPPCKAHGGNCDGQAVPGGGLDLSSPSVASSYTCCVSLFNASILCCCSLPP